MSTSFIPDPMQFWRDAVTRLENDFNAAATGSLKSQELVRALHQFSNATMGVQQLFEKAIDGYLRRANLPSHKDVAELGEALRRIEDKLDQLVPGGPPGGVRPARTRRPASAAAPAAATTDVPPAAAVPVEAPAAPPSGKARKASRRAPARSGKTPSRSRGKP
jgi:hypothetical protein